MLCLCILGVGWGVWGFAGSSPKSGTKGWPPKPKSSKLQGLHSSLNAARNNGALLAGRPSLEPTMFRQFSSLLFTAQ
eukprot:3317643-Amphidinium_carterae.1